jgi:hypothetical protein
MSKSGNGLSISEKKQNFCFRESDGFMIDFLLDSWPIPFEQEIRVNWFLLPTTRKKKILLSNFFSPKKTNLVKKNHSPAALLNNRVLSFLGSRCGSAVAAIRWRCYKFEKLALLRCFKRLESQAIKPGANSTIVSYNASAVKFTTPRVV